MSPLDKKRENIRAMFDSIAYKYDFLNHFCSAGIDRSWRKRVVGLIGSSGARKVLDVATGTGDLAIAMAKKCPALEVTGIDLSDGMLEIGRKKVEAAGLSGRIVLKQEDALGMGFADADFDAVTVAFGVRNFEDLHAGLREIRRVLRPGGRLYVLELSMPRYPLIAGAYRLYFSKVLPAIGRITSQDPFAYTYLPESVMEFPSGKPFMQILETCGYREISARSLTGGIASLYRAEK